MEKEETPPSILLFWWGGGDRSGSKTRLIRADLNLHIYKNFFWGGVLLFSSVFQFPSENKSNKIDFVKQPVYWWERGGKKNLHAIRPAFCFYEKVLFTALEISKWSFVHITDQEPNCLFQKWFYSSWTNPHWVNLSLVQLVIELIEKVGGKKSFF